MLKSVLIAACAALCVRSGVLAQDGSPPAKPEEAQAPALPWTVGADPRDSWTLKDDALRSLVDTLTGTFASADSSGGSPALQLHTAPMNVDGLSNALFFQINRADDPANPFRSGVFAAYRNQGQARVRVYDFDKAEMGPALTGMWMVPYAIPTLKLSDLRPNLDLAFEDLSAGPMNKSVVGETPHPYPTVRDGAVEMTSRMAVGPDGIEMADRGFDASGKQVWGPKQGESIVFKPAKPHATVHTTDDGLITIDLVHPEDSDEQPLKEGGTVVVEYSGYLTTGKEFDTSRQEGRQPFRTQIPGRLIKGWNEGMIGITKGTRRRLIIPPSLGYGNRAVGRGLIPANSTLVFDIEALWVDNPKPGEAPPPPPQPARQRSQGKDQTGKKQD